MKTLMRIFLILDVGLTGATLRGETSLVQRMDVVAHRFDFEESIPEGWHLESGDLELSKDVYKHGEQSLQWNWEGCAPLLLDNPQGLKGSQEPYEGVPETFEIKFNKLDQYGGIKMWLYADEEMEGELTFLVGDKGTIMTEPRYKFTVDLAFTGWRTVWVDFERDAKADGEFTSTEPALHLAVLPPSGVDSGTVYFDLFQFMRYVSFKRQSDTLFAGHRHDLDYDRARNLILKDWVAKPETEVSILTDSHRSDFNSIEERFDRIVLGGHPDHEGPLFAALSHKLDKWIANGVAFYDTLDIREANGRVFGRPLYASRDEHGTEDGYTFQLISQETCFQLALDWKLNGNPSSREKFIRLLNYYNEQGWASGHALGTANHLIRIVGYGISVMVMRNELEEAGILSREQETLQWYCGLGHAFSFDPDRGENADLVRAQALCKLVSILLMKDSPEKVNAMLGYREYLHFLCTPAPGYRDTIKPDFTGFHHLAAYMNAYSPDAMATLSLLHYLMSGTIYAVDDVPSENIRNALLTQRTMANLYDIHFGVSGRFPHNNNSFDMTLAGFAYMAMSEPESSGNPMLAAYLRLWAGLGQVSYTYKDLLYGTVPRMTYLGTVGLFEILDTLGSSRAVAAEPSPTGNWVYPYAALAVHRRDEWMATVRGWSQYVWDFESHQGENDFGRYISHGTLFLVGNGDPVSFIDSGYDIQVGFDWAMLPGATTKDLPMEKLQYRGIADEKYGEGKHRSFTDETFVGGLSLDGRDGMFSMRLHDTVSPDEDKAMYDSSFRAVKSYFFFDNEIICLGSGISNDDIRYDTVTTLFQSKLTPDANTVTINGLTRVGFAPMRKEVKGETLLMDPYGNGYVTTGESSVVIRNSEQTSTHSVRHEPETAPYSVAWLNHGNSPDGEGYEYAILVNTTTEELEKFAADKPYRVVRRDDNAHILYHLEKQAHAYALFDPGLKLESGPLLSTNTPAMVMIRESGNDAITLSVVDPDLRLHKQYNMSFMPPELASKPSKAAEVILEVRGRWEVTKGDAKIPPTYDKDATTLAFTCVNGLHQEVSLRRLK